MFSRFFIERPIFANVIAIMTMLVGAVDAVRAADRAVSRHHAADGPGLDDLPRRRRQGPLRHRRLADRAGGQRRRGDALHVLHLLQRRLVQADRHLRGRHRPRQGAGPGAEPAGDRPAEAPGRRSSGRGSRPRSSRPTSSWRSSLISPDNRYDDLFLSNFATLRVKDELSRIYGVGDIQVFGSGNYGMRIWLDPEKLKARNLTTEDVLAAIREQNVQVAAGQVGQSPSPKGQGFQYNVTTLGRLSDPEEFGDIIVKADDSIFERSDDGVGAARLTRVKDVARVELGSQVYDQWCEIGGKPAATLAVFQLPGANALDVAKKVEAAMERAQAVVPRGAGILDPVQHDDLRRGVDPRGLQDPVRGGRARPDRDPRLPPGLAGRADPGDDRAGDDHRRLRGDGGPGLLGQHADALRPGPGHRHRRRRRDRDRRERRPPHRPRQAAAQGGDDQGDVAR